MELSNKGDKKRIIADAGVATIPSSILGLSTNRATSADNGAATVALTAKPGMRWVVYGYSFSYDGEPTGGTITLTRGASTVIDQQAVTSAGPGPIQFPRPLHGAANEAMTATLAAGGAGVFGRLTLFAELEPG